MTLLEGLSEGRWAVVSKIHHCLVDGVGGIDVGQLLLDPSPDPCLEVSNGHKRSTVRPANAGEANGARSGSRLPRWTPPGMLWHGGRAAVDVALHPEQLLELARRAQAMAGVLVRDELVAAPEVESQRADRRHATLPGSAVHAGGLQGDQGESWRHCQRRRACAVRRRASQPAGGARRRAARGRPAQAGRGQIPVNIRAATEELDLGNHLTSLFIPLHVAEADPL